MLHQSAKYCHDRRSAVYEAAYIQSGVWFGWAESTCPITAAEQALSMALNHIKNFVYIPSAGCWVARSSKSAP